MIRLSVTDLDSYLYWRDSEEMSLDELLARLRGQQEPTLAMQAGRAFHKLFEDVKASTMETAEVDGFRFIFALDNEISVPPLRELKGERIIKTPSGPVTLVGKVDGMNGLTVNDYKLTERFDVERYIDSYQWRSYLMMFDAKKFVYDVFLCRYGDDEKSAYIYDYHQLPLCAYPEIVADVEREVAGLAEIVARYVPEKVSIAA